MPLGGFTLPGATATGLGPAAMRLSGQPSSGSVLLVSNLNEEVHLSYINNRNKQTNEQTNEQTKMALISCFGSVIIVFFCVSISFIFCFRLC